MTAPCCAEFARRQAAFDAKLKALHDLGALSTPRAVTQLYASMNPADLVLMAADRCPCNDTPDPEATRAEMVRLMELSQ